MLIAVATVLAVVAAGFAVVNLRGGGRAGASSPEAAVDQFFGAIANEDLVGVLEEMAPGERNVMVSWFQGLESNLSDLGILDDVDLNDVSGVDIEVDGLESQVEEVMPGVSRIYVTDGQLSFVTEPDSVPVGDVLEDLIEANGGEVDIERAADEVDFGDAAAEGDDSVFLVATEQDGRWYLSLSYTIAEYARLDAGLEPPDPDAGVEPQGAGSAEEAASQFLEASVELDVERLISLLPPDEMGALQTYAPLFLDDAQESVEEMRVEDGYEGSVEGLEFDTSGVDGGTRVVPTAGSASFAFDDGEVSVSLDDGCIEATGEVGEEYEDDFGTTVICRDDLGDLGDELTQEERDDLEELGSLFEGYQPGLVVVERDGAFYVDPLRTFSDLTLQMFDGVERADLEEGGILYRIFTGDSVLFPEVEEDYGDYDDEYSDDDYTDDEYDDGLDEDLGDEDFDDPLGDDPSDDPLDDPLDDSSGEIPDMGPDYEAGYGVGFEEGFVDGTGDGVAGTYASSLDTSPPVAPPDVEDPSSYELGYMDGYFIGYEDGFAASCDPNLTVC